MKLATIRVGATTTAARLDGDVLVDLGIPDVGAPTGLAGTRRPHGASGS